MTDNRELRPALPSFELLPAIDLHGGRVVRLLRGDYRSATTYGDDPAAIADAFAEGGARWLHVVDLDGARDQDARQTRLVAAIVARVGARASVEVAGGLRDDRAVETSLDAGAARVILGTAALRDAGFAGRLSARFGPERIAVARVEIFEVTAIDRDGTLQGPDLALLDELVRLGCGAVIASAGVAGVADIAAVRALGCAGAIVGRALYEGRMTLEEALAAAR